MGFNVQPDELDDFGQVLDQQAQHAVSGTRYARETLNLSRTDRGLLALLIGAHDEVQSEVTRSLDQLATACDQAGAEIREVAALYRNSDQENAERLDASYPGVRRPLPRSTTQASPIAETRSPSQALQAPEAPEEFQNPIEPVITITNLLSVGYWAQQVLEVTIQCNPVTEVSELVGGDWESYAQCASAFRSLGEFVGSVAGNIEPNNDRLGVTWSGNAADNAYAYFYNLASSIADHGDGYRELHDKYMEAAKGVWEFSLFVAGEIQGLFDKVFWIAAEAAAGAALAETGVGPVLMWSIAAFQCKQVVDDWARISKEILNIQRLVRTVHGNILTAIGASGSFQQHPLPSGGYRHPGLR